MHLRPGIRRSEGRSRPVEAMSQARRTRAWRAILVRGVAYFALWMIMAGGRLAEVAPGLAAATLATWISLVLLPLDPAFAQVRALAVLRLALRFVWGSVVAGLDIARRAFSPSLPLKPGYVTYPVALPPGTSRNLFTSLTSLMPGTLPTGTDESGHVIYHCLDVEQPVQQELGQEEAQLVAALGAAAGGAAAAAPGSESGSAPS
jgi:multicomponent Na+:H+ antiporter subunit E